MVDDWLHTEGALIQFAGRSLARPGHAQTIWLGDSHVSFLAGGPPRWALVSKRSGDVICWLGPRLMFSIATRGFPTYQIRRLARIAGPRTQLAILLGEIDVRVHLGKAVARGDLDLAFVDEYVRNVADLASRCRRHPVLVVPVPPAGDENLEHQYPKVGALEDRVLAQLALASKLKEAGHAYGVDIFDASRELSLSDGSLRSEFTDDGFHLNARGSKAF